MKISENSKKLLDLAIPATIENILQVLVGFIDTFLISRLGLIAVTAVGIANNIFSVYLAIIIAVGVGTSSLISRYLGAKNVDKAKQIAIQSTVLSITIGIIFGIVTIIFNDQILNIIGADREVVYKALPYFNIVGGATVFISILTIKL